MDNKKAFLDHAAEFLIKEDFLISNTVSRAACFDLIAKKHSFLMILKFLFNIDSISPELATDLKVISRFLSAYPLIIGEKARNHPLEDGVLHQRQGLGALTFKTFTDIFCRNTYPLVKSQRGGYYVNLDGEKLKRIRLALDISVGELADHLGVSRTMVYSYENSGFGMTVQTMVKLEEFFSDSFTLPLNVFTIPPRSDDEAGGSPEWPFIRLGDIGFGVRTVKRAPFDALAKGDDNLFLSKVEKNPESRSERLKVIKEVSDISNCLAFLITDSNDCNENVMGIPIIRHKELEDLECQEEFIEIIEERS